MRRPLVHLLIAFVLLLQGVGSAWAATRMAAGDVQITAHIANLPPCHQAAAKSDAAKLGMRCCGSGSCHCEMSCGALPVLAFAANGTLWLLQAMLLTETVQPALQAGHYGSALRPPAAFQT